MGPARSCAATARVRRRGSASGSRHRAHETPTTPTARRRLYAQLPNSARCGPHRAAEGLGSSPASRHHPNGDGVATGEPRLRPAPSPPPDGGDQTAQKGVCQDFWVRVSRWRSRGEDRRRRWPLPDGVYSLQGRRCERAGEARPATATVRLDTVAPKLDSPGARRTVQPTATGRRCDRAELRAREPEGAPVRCSTATSSSFDA